MIGLEPAFHSSGFLAVTESPIPGDYSRVADFRDQIRGIQIPIAIDHQTRSAAEDRRSIENLRKQRRDARRANIPGDMPGQSLRG
jgi:hypothetical protein